MERAKEEFAEAHRVDVLTQQVGSWRLADNIRAYCAALRVAINKQDEAFRQEGEAWAAWAEQHAADIDPIRHPVRMPEIPEPGADNLKPFLRGQSPYGPSTW